MSVVALSDLLFGDLLTETNMKPWWEKVRGYIFASSTAFALSATYITLNGVPVNCLPVNTGNSSFTCNFNSKDWTNIYCSNRIPWFFSYFGAMCLVAAIVLLVLSSLWLHKPKVIDSFVTFVEMEKIISDTDLTLEDMRKMSCQPLESQQKDDKQSKLRKVCVEFWEGGRDFQLVAVYQTRNYILIVSSSIIGVVFMIIAYLMISQGDRFQCNLAHEDKEILHGNDTFPESFFCVVPMAYRLIMFDLIFMLTVFAQTVPILWGMRKWKLRKKIMHGFDNADFMRYFWKYGRPSRSKTFSRFIKHVCGTSVVQDIENKLGEAISIGDHDLLRNYVTLVNTHNARTHGQSQINKNVKRIPGDIIMTAVHNIYQSALSKKTKDGVEDLCKMENAFVTTIEKYVTGVTTVDKYRPLLEKASGDRRWRFFVRILNEYICKNDVAESGREGYKLLTDLRVECDILDDHGCCVMHYFLDKPRLHSIAALVHNEYARMGFKLYAHSQGKSSLVSKTINITSVDSKLVAGTSNLPSGQKRIKKCHERFVGILKSTGALDMDEFERTLSQVKFHKWDDDALEFAKKSRLWPHFAILLNCYIVPENAFFPLPCGVTEDFERHAIIPALRQQKPFVSTAAKHIISCFTQDQRINAVSEIERAGLEDADKRELLQFVDWCNKSGNRRESDRDTIGLPSAKTDQVARSDKDTMNLPVAKADKSASSSVPDHTMAPQNESCDRDVEAARPLLP